MAGFFESIFQRKPIQINVYNNAVNPHVNFKKRTFRALQALYADLVDVRIIEDYKSDSISKIPVGVFNQKDEEVFGTPLNLLIDQSNPSQSWQELLKEMLVYYGTTGNLFSYYYEGYFYALSTADVKAVLGLSKEIPEFMNYVSGYYLDMDYGRPVPLELENVFHMKTSQLESREGLWVYGSSPYEAALPNITALESNYSARVSVIRDRSAMALLSNESEIPDEDQTRQVQAALNDYGITEGKAKVIATTQKLKYNQMLLGLSELQLIDNLQVDFTKLCNVNGIDPLIFASQGATYANQEEAHKGTVRKALVPLAEHFYNKFNEFLRPHFGGLRILPKLDQVPEYKDLGLEQSTKVISEVNAGVLSRSQALEILYPDMEYEPQESQADEVVEDIKQLFSISTNGN